MEELKKYMKNLGGAGIVNYDPQTKEFFSDMVNNFICNDSQKLFSYFSKRITTLN